MVFAVLNIIASEYHSCPAVLWYLIFTPEWVCDLLWWVNFNPLFCVSMYRTPYRLKIFRKKMNHENMSSNGASWYQLRRTWHHLVGPQMLYLDFSMVDYCEKRDTFNVQMETLPNTKKTSLACSHIKQSEIIFVIL